MTLADFMFYIGIDLGQRIDYTAIAVVERRQPVIHGFDHLHWLRTVEKLPDEWAVRRLERIPLGTPYTKVVDRLAELARHPKLAGHCRMVIDATGVGAPVVDMLKAANIGCEIVPVVFSAGTQESFDGKTWRVPKLDLLARLQMLFEQQRLKVPRKLKESSTLVRELLDTKAKPRPRGNVRIGADAAGQHDDLVMALALAVWMGRAQKGSPVVPKRLI
jgi:hypothetical protein